MPGYIGLEDYERRLERLKGAQRWASAQDTRRTPRQAGKLLTLVLSSF